MKTAYICHPFSGNEAANIITVTMCCKRITTGGHLNDYIPFAPHLYFPQIFDDKKSRDIAMAGCIAMMRSCDEIFVVGRIISPGMGEELSIAIKEKIPVRFFPTYNFDSLRPTANATVIADAIAIGAYLSKDDVSYAISLYRGLRQLDQRKIIEEVLEGIDPLTVAFQGKQIAKLWAELQRRGLV